MRMNALMRLWGTGLFNLNLDLLSFYAAGVPLLAAVAFAALKLAQASLRLSKHGASSNFLLPLLRTTVDWDRNVRMLTDRYSPANLLNAMARRSRDVQ